MGVIMGKIIMHDTENQTQLILQAGDEESLKKQVEGIDMLERKAKAFDEIKKSIIQIKCNYKGNEERINKFIARETEYIMNREDK